MKASKRKKRQESQNVPKNSKNLYFSQGGGQEVESRKSEVKIQNMAKKSKGSLKKSEEKNPKNPKNIKASRRY